MNRTRRLLATIALISIVALISACGSSAPAGTGTGTGIGSGGGNGTGSGAGNGGNATATATKGVRFAECMRSHGVSKFPDPGASGRFTIDGVVNGSSLDPSAPAFKQAISACQELEPAGFTGGGKRSPLQMNAALRFAQCIRAHGVRDFPDPVNGQPLVDTNRIPSAATSSGLSTLNAAMQNCRALSIAARGPS